MNKRSHVTMKIGCTECEKRNSKDADTHRKLFILIANALVQSTILWLVLASFRLPISYLQTIGVWVVFIETMSVIRGGARY